MNNAAAKQDLVKTYRVLSDGSLERIRYSQTEPEDRIRIIDGPGIGEKDGMTVYTVVGKPRFRMRDMRWELACDDKHERKPISKSLFEKADANMSDFVRRTEPFGQPIVNGSTG